MTEEEFCDKVDEWNSTDTDLSLHEWMGISWGEYCQLVEANCRSSLSIGDHKALLALAAKAIATPDTRTEEQIIDDAVAFVMAEPELNTVVIK